MTKTLDWQSLREPATDAMISDVEQLITHKLPSDFVQYAQIYHGAMTSDNNFVYTIKNNQEHSSSMAQLFSFELDTIDGIVSWNQDLSLQIPSGLVAFAVDGGDGFVCFDYRGNEENPTIVFWIQTSEHGDVYPLAKNFSEFIEKLES